jgi:GxxExxY protein
VTDQTEVFDRIYRIYRIGGMEHEELTQRIIGCAMTVHKALGPGFLESVYQKALQHELIKAGMHCECGTPIDVRYDCVVVGEFVCDVLVKGKVLIEIKANQSLVPANEAQLVNYLSATGLDVGLLLNFGASSLGVKRKSRIYRKAPKSEIIL